MRREFYIEPHDWKVEVYCLSSTFDSRPILGSLRALNPKDEDFLVVKDLLRSGGSDWGFTYSSYQLRSSVMVIGVARNQAEYFDTLVHETYHLAKHIAQCDGLDPFSEDVAYIAGDAARDIYRAFRDMLCLCN